MSRAGENTSKQLDNLSVLIKERVKEDSSGGKIMHALLDVVVDLNMRIQLLEQDLPTEAFIDPHGGGPSKIY